MNVVYPVVYGVLVMCDAFVWGFVVVVANAQMAVEVYLEIVCLNHLSLYVFVVHRVVNFEVKTLYFDFVYLALLFVVVK